MKNFYVRHILTTSLPLQETGAQMLVSDIVLPVKFMYPISQRNPSLEHEFYTSIFLHVLSFVEQLLKRRLIVSIHSLQWIPNLNQYGREVTSKQINLYLERLDETVLANGF